MIKALFFSLLLLAGVPTGAPAAAATPPPHEAVLPHADALVTVKFVLKVKVQGGGERESEGEVTCPLIDPEGLVLCSNTDLGGYMILMARLMGRGESVSAVPTGLEVVLPGSSEGLEARLVTRDSDRDLAWVQIEEPPEEALPHLDFTRSVEPAVGEPYFYLRRLNKFFGAEPLVVEAILGARIFKPRPLLVPRVPRMPGFGVPAFTADGRPVGLTVLQMPSSADGAGFLGGAMSVLGTSVDVQDMIGGLVLPGEEIVRATALARELEAERAAEDAAETPVDDGDDVPRDGTE